jgi:O-antigen/teichoic acid export membrane protein
MGSLLSGLAFSVIVARGLNEEDFGTWAFVGRLVSYFASTAIFINFWAARDAGRGAKPLKTALLGSGIMATILSLLYLGITSHVASTIGRESWVVLLGLIQLPLLHLLNTVEGVSSGHKPIIAVYGFMVFEIVKLFFVFLAVYAWGLGLVGLFVSLALAQLIQLFLLVYLQRNILGEINLMNLLKWLKGFPVLLIGVVIDKLSGLDIFIGALLYGSALPLSYWQAAITIALVAGFYSNLTIGLYPALLSGGGIKEIEKVFKFAMMFGIPFLFGILLLGRDMLLLLKPIYAEAAPCLYVLTLSYWINGLGSLFSTIVSGKEDVDKRSDITILDYVSSSLFKYGLVISLLNVVYVVSFSLMTIAARAGGWGFVETAYSWAYVHLVINVAITIISYLFSRQRVVYKIPWINITRYVIASVLMLALIYPLYLTIPVANVVAVQLIRVTVMVATGIAAYFGTLILLDKESKKMLRFLFARLVK